MHFLHSLTEKHGALLILDEVITGFRLDLGGASEYYAIKPDLVCFGKIVGGGLPVGAFGGRSDIMDTLSPVGSVYQAGTLSGNPVAMAAGLATLRKLADGKIYARLEDVTANFVADLRLKLNDVPVSIASIASIFWIAFQRELPRSIDSIETQGIDTFNSIHGLLLEQNIYLPPSGFEVCFVSAAHTEEALQETVLKIAKVIHESL
jgi:glutamate-1-semialdehyde 2,1-aminomutase